MSSFRFQPSPSLFRRFKQASRPGRVLVSLLAAAAYAMTGARAEIPSALMPLKVGYLAELPVSWRTGLEDPLRNIARSLGPAFARPVDLEIPLPTENVFGADSWDELQRTILLGTTELVPLQSYEMLQHGRDLNLKPLLLATRNGRWQTRFLLLAAPSAEIQTLNDLKERTILIHRDGCGNLVDFWLDAAIAVGTGVPRKSFARYQTVTQAREAVLPVFFGEADACVVSEAAYLAVCAQNPAQIPQKLSLTLATSGDMPSQVVACKIDLPVDVQRQVVNRALQLKWQYGNQSGGLIAAEELAFDHLSALLNQRSHPTAKPIPTSPVRPPAQLQTSTPAIPKAKRP